MAKVSLCVLTSATDIANFQMQGLAFDSLETVFKATDVKMMLDLEPLAVPTNSTVFVVVDPAAGGPSSDYAVVSIARVRGTVNVSLFLFWHVRLCLSCCSVELPEEDDEVQVVVKLETGVWYGSPFSVCVVEVYGQIFFIKTQIQCGERKVKHFL